MTVTREGDFGFLRAGQWDPVCVDSFQHNTRCMPEHPTGREAAPASGAWFTTTRWSVVLAAGGPAAPESARALESLCSAYWYPLYAWLRWQGHGRPEAQDLTQSFFSHLLQDQRLRQVDRARGKFRSFLLGSLKHFVANEWDKARALKRGGRFQFVSIDEDRAEDRFAAELTDGATPDRAFEQIWATTLLEGAIGRLREEHLRDGKGALFDTLQVYLSGDRGAVPYAETQARLGLGESALKMAVLRLRRRFGELLREEIAHTVSRPEEIDEEIRALFAAVSR